MFTPVKTTSLMPEFSSFFTSFKVLAIEAFLLFPLASGMVQNEQK